MNKKQFLEKLDSGLKKIEKKERQQVLDFYDNYIEEATVDESTEEEVIKKIGDVKLIVNKIKSEYHVKKLDESPHIVNLLKAIVSVFRRVPLFESIRAGVSTSFKMILFLVISLIIVLLGIAIFIFGISTSFVFLYSPVIILNVMFDNIFLLALSLFTFFLIHPAFICIVILTIYGLIKTGKWLFNKFKRKLERIMIIFDFCIIVPGVIYLYTLFAKNKLEIAGMYTPQLILFEALSIIVLGVTGIAISILITLSRKLNKKISKSLNKVLVKLEGEKV